MGDTVRSFDEGIKVTIGTEGYNGCRLFRVRYLRWTLEGAVESYAMITRTSGTVLPQDRKACRCLG